MADTFIGSRAERGSSKSAGFESSLLTRCLSGDRLAWEEFCEECTPELRRLVRFFLGANGDDDTIEEIVACVWYALLRDDARVLRRYSPGRSSCLGCYLAGVVRRHVGQHRRAEWERLRHTRQLASRVRSVLVGRAPEVSPDSLLHEFAATLNPKELDFLERYLLCAQDGSQGGLSAGDIWQRRHRLRVKLWHFLSCNDD